MGKATILTVLGFMFAGGFYAFSAQRNQVETKESISRHQMEVLARNAALAGHSRAQQLLADDFKDYSASGKYEGVHYEYQVRTSGSSITLGGVSVSVGGTEKATIKTIGTYRPGDGDPVTFTVQSLYQQEDVLPDNPPPHMEYVLLAENTLDMRGNIDALVADGDSTNRLNANTHANGTLQVKGNSVDVKGFGTYAGSLGGNHVANAFTPSYNPSTQATVQQTNTINIPTFDPATTLTEFGGADKTSSGGLTLSGTHDFTASGATRDNPYVWHVDGNLELGGDAMLEGYVVFVVEGDILLKGKDQLQTTANNSESNAAFYTANAVDIDLKGGSELHGQVFAGGDADIEMRGSSKFYGTITTGGSATLKGTPDLYYRPASPGLTQNWQTMKKQERLIAHNQW